MSVGGAVNAAYKQGTIYLKCVIDGSLKYASPIKIRGGSCGGGTLRQTNIKIIYGKC
jgi:hypothetical protein